MKKIISTFLFSEPSEKNLILCKFHSEYEIVEEFIGIESHYTTRGKYKGAFLNEVLQHEDFAPFRDKITVLTNENSFYPVGVEYSEQNNLLSEFCSRAYCWDYVSSKYDDSTWLTLCDADELLDFSHPKRRDILLDIFEKNDGGIDIPCIRYWWDFDNYSHYEKYTPCHTIGHLRSLEKPFHNRNWHTKRVTPEICVSYEYSHCMSAAGNWSKVNKAAHDKYTEEVMNNAYKYNTWHKEPARGERLNYPYDFFETIELNETNAPQFVLENLDKLKVNTIDPAYAENRFRDLGLSYPHPLEQCGLLGANRIRRSYHYYRRNK